MEFNQSLTDNSNNNSQFQQGLRNSFNASQSAQTETVLPLPLPPIVPTEHIRYKQDVIKAANDIKADWLIECKENKSGYTDALSKCLERFSKEMDKMHEITPVRIISVMGLEYYGFKLSWTWLSYMMHKNLWPNTPNPFPDPFDKSNNNNTNTSVNLQPTYSTHVKKPATYTPTYSATPVKKTETIQPTYTPTYSPTNAPIASSVSENSVPKNAPIASSVPIEPKSYICLDKDFKGSGHDLTKAMLLIIHNGLPWDSLLKKKKWVSNDEKIGGIAETLASFCSTTYNMSTQVPMVNKYYYHNNPSIPKKQRPDVIEKCGSNNRNAAFRFKSQEIYNFFNKRFVIQKSNNVSINTPIKPLSKLNINTPSKRKLNDTTYDPFRVLTGDDENYNMNEHDYNNNNFYGSPSYNVHSNAFGNTSNAEPPNKKMRYSSTTNIKENEESITTSEAIALLENFKKQVNNGLDNIISRLQQKNEF